MSCKLANKFIEFQKPNTNIFTCIVVFLKFPYFGFRWSTLYISRSILHVYIANSYNIFVFFLIPFFFFNLTAHIPEAITTNCSKCTDAQVKIIKKTSYFIMKNRPEDWERIRKKFDPEEKYKDSFIKFINEH